MNLSTTGLSLAADSATDLQLHTTYSDGRWTLEPLLDYLLREQFDLVAITDHDRADTVAAIQQHAIVVLPCRPFGRASLCFRLRHQL